MAIDPNSLKSLKEHSRKEILLSVARQPGTSRLFVGGSDTRIYALDVMAEKPEAKELSGHSGYVSGLAIVGEGKQLVSGSFDGRLIWWNTETLEPVRTVEAHSRWIRGVTASTDGRLVASVADDMVGRVWEASTGKLLHELRGHEPKTPHHFPSMLYCCAISRDGRRLATGDRVGRVLVWDVDSGKQLAAVEAPIMYTWDPKQRIHSIGGVRSLAFSPDGKLLAVGGMGTVGNIDHLEGLARVEVFDWEKQERTHEFKGETFKGLVERLVFAPDGAWLLAAGGDQGGFYKFFDLAANKIIRQDKAAVHIHDLVTSEQGDTIFAVGHGRIMVWQLG